MANPFKHHSLSLKGPATDIMPVIPNDAQDLTDGAIALYVETAGSISFVSAAGQSRTISVANFSILPVGVLRVLDTGTTATGIHALVLS